MIYGVVGTLDRDTMMKFGLYNMKTGRFQRVASKKGNGKTLVLTYYGYRENKELGRKVYSNYHTKFSEYRTAQDVFTDLGRLLDLAGRFGGYGTITEIIKNFEYIMAKYSLSQEEQAELYELRSLFHKYYKCLILLTEFQKFFNSLGTSTKTIKWVEGILTQLRKLEIDVMWDAQRPISAGNRSREYTETFLVPQKFHSDDLSPCTEDICSRDHLIYVYSDIPFRENPLVILVASEVGQLYDTNEIIGDNLSSPTEVQAEEKKKNGKKRRVSEAERPVLISNKTAPLKEEEPDEEILDQISYIPVEEEVIPVEPEAEPEITLDEIEMEMLKTASHVPDIIKALLPKYRESGRIHDIFLKYFTDDGEFISATWIPFNGRKEIEKQSLIDLRTKIKEQVSNGNEAVSTIQAISVNEQTHDLPMELFE